VAGNWTKISAISAISVSPKRKRTALYIRFYSGKNIKAPQVERFLYYFLRHLKGPVILLWDKSMVHRAGLVKRRLRRHKRINAYFFPGYAPELNPAEFIWAQLKRAAANSVPKNLAHLKNVLLPPLYRIRNSQRLLWSCIRASDLLWQ